MDQLLELFFGNLIIIIAIVGGILGLFQKRQHEKEKQAPKRQRPYPTHSPTPSGKVNPEAQTASQSRPPVEEHHPIKQMKDRAESYYEKQQALLKEKKAKNNKNSRIQGAEISQGGNIHDALKDSSDDTYKVNDKVDRRSTRIDITRNLNKNGLAESVIMAEVLGSPRALKPYRSIVNRNKN
jgi:hypothetical protein